MKQVNGQRTTQGFLMDGIDRLLCDNECLRLAFHIQVTSYYSIIDIQPDLHELLKMPIFWTEYCSFIKNRRSAYHLHALELQFIAEISNCPLTLYHHEGHSPQLHSVHSAPVPATSTHPQPGLFNSKSGKTFKIQFGLFCHVNVGAYHNGTNHFEQMDHPLP